MMDLQKLLDQIDLRALAEEAGAILSRNNASVCPLHPGADNPTAFRLYNAEDGRQRWHCFTRCPQGENDGDAIGFYMRWRGVDFATAVQELAERFGFDRSTKAAERPSRLTTSSPLAPLASPPGDAWQARAQAMVDYAQGQLWSEAGCAALAYLREDRGLNDDTIKQWRLGYNPRDLWDEPARWGLESGKRIWLPRGVVMPGRRDGVTWYIKVRRPLPGDGLARRIGAVTHLSEVKFGGPRGGRATLFGADRLSGLPLILLAEGEFDAMLAWQAAGDLCDVATLGGARHRLDVDDAIALTGAWVILAVYDSDEAGADGNGYLRTMSRRVVAVQPPAHDLSAYWQEGGNLRAWIARTVAGQMEHLLEEAYAQQWDALFVRWLKVFEQALDSR